VRAVLLRRVQGQQEQLLHREGMQEQMRQGCVSDAKGDWNVQSCLQKMVFRLKIEPVQAVHLWGLWWK